MAIRSLEGILSRRDFLRSAGKGAVVYAGTQVMSMLSLVDPALATELTKEEPALYEKLKSAPKGRGPITGFPEIVAGVDKGFPRILGDAYEHRPPIGIDYEVSTSFPYTPIVAPARGRVGIAGFHPRYGYRVVITHGGNNYTERGRHITVNAHLHPLLLVQKGDIVERGTLIGFGGNTGSNARGVYHYHIGAAESTFGSLDKKLRSLINDPHTYAEKNRLGTWNGNDLDSDYIDNVRNAHQYANTLINKLPENKPGKIAKSDVLGVKLGFLHDLSEKEILQEYVKENPNEIKENLERLMSLKPTYTLFVNPKRLDLYHVIIH